MATVWTGTPRSASTASGSSNGSGNGCSPSDSSTACRSALGGSTKWITASSAAAKLEPLLR